MKVLNPTSGFPAWGSDKGLGIARESGLEGQRDLIVDLPEDWGKQILVLEGINKILHAPKPRGEEQWSHRRWNQNYLLQRHGSAGAHHKDGALEGPPWPKSSWSVTQSCLPLWPHQASLSITSSRSLLKLMSIKLVMPSNHLILWRPLLLPPSIFPTIRVFSNVLVPRIRWPKYYAWTNSL